MLALLAAVENVLPPVPSDAAVALGAFLSHRGVTTPLAVFLVTWVANLLGAAGVYVVARRYGRRLFASPTGRRLLAPRSLAIIEREYLRLGTAGIFISRFLPGIRAVVPPFAGLVGLGAFRTLAPMGLASAIWYGGITILGAAGAGDIGLLFPDTDPQWKDADSMELLRTAHELVRGRGLTLAQADCSVITERPKLSPYIAAMAAALASRLGVDVGAVSVKAKTNEGMGFIGRGEGLAVIAVVVLEAR